MIMNNIIEEDLKYIAQSDCIPWNKLRNQTLLITGASGLIGKNLLRALIYANQVYRLNLTILALVRNPAVFKCEFTDSALEIIEGSVEDLPDIDLPVNYVIHGASPTASAFFVSHPVDTIHTAIWGTDKLLQLADKKKVKSFVYLSSMEVYGKVTTDALLTEKDLGYLDLSSVRNCYPISKRLCENLCACYYKQHQVPAMSVRLAQTFGPGVSFADVRVFAMLARCAINKEDIVLQTKGESKHPYLYTADAVIGILCALLKGRSGQTYNLSNPTTYCSIYEMAQLVAQRIAQPNIQVHIAENGDVSKYPSSSFLNLDITLAKQLGWQPQIGLEAMYRRMMQTMQGYEK